MKYPAEARLDTVVADEELFAAEELNDPPAADDPLAGARLLAGSERQRTCADYGEEAIPERDPAYRLSDATQYATQTAEHVPAAERLALARCLERLGMSRTRAALLASL